LRAISKRRSSPKGWGSDRNQPTVGRSLLERKPIANCGPQANSGSVLKQRASWAYRRDSYREENDGKVSGVTNPDEPTAKYSQRVRPNLPADHMATAIYETGGKTVYSIEIEYSGGTRISGMQRGFAWGQNLLKHPKLCFRSSWICVIQKSVN